MERERLQYCYTIPFRNFKEKIKITKKYERLAKVEIIDDKYVMLVWRGNIGERIDEQENV